MSGVWRAADAIVSWVCEALDGASVAIFGGWWSFRERHGPEPEPEAELPAEIERAFVQQFEAEVAEAYRGADRKGT